MKVLPVYDYRYLKTIIRAYGDKVYTNFQGLNVPEDEIECESYIHFYRFFYSFIDYLNSCAYKIADKRMVDCLGENCFETDEDFF